MVAKTVKLTGPEAQEGSLVPTYGARALARPLPKYELPADGLDPQTAYRVVRDELMLDGNARLNLATFVTTWMEPEAARLMAETFDKNMIDKDEYPQTAEIESRCVNMLARLYHAPEDGRACGTSTVGSSEAAMLAGMAMKWNWKARRTAAGKAAERPNLVMGINVQVCWEKFCRYWEVEPRYVPIERGRYVIDPAQAIALCDENTIGVIGILGTTFTGEYEPIAALDAALEDLDERTGWNVPLHVDGASGAFVAPFLQPDLAWDFRLKRVVSINVSGHKYGLVYPGVGWVLWRDWSALPEDLIFHVNYLGGDMPTFALNFSRPGNQVVAQYYNFLRLGRDGYRRIMTACRDTALRLSGRIAEMGPFELLSDGSAIPVFAFSVKAGEGFSVFDLSDKLREKGWLVPAYTLPEACEELAVLRIVVKEGFSRDMAEMLLGDLARAVAHFRARPEHQAARAPARGKVNKPC